MANALEPPRRFRLATRPILVFAALTLIPALAAWPFVSPALASMVLAACLFQDASFYFICQVEVTRNGLRLNRINFLPWGQISRVALSNVLGLKYLKAYRIGGRWPWWFPLYLADEDGFRRAVVERAPAGNPVRALFEAEASEKL